MTAENLSTVGKFEMCGSLLIKKIISCKLGWNILPLLLFFFSIKQTLWKQCEIYYEREHAHFPNIPVSPRKRGSDDLEDTFLYTQWLFAGSGHDPSAGSDRRGHDWWIRAKTIEITYWVSHSHHQTNPNSSFVCCTSSTTFPSQGFNDSSSTMFPGGGYCSQIERIHHLEFFPFYWL